MNMRTIVAAMVRIAAIGLVGTAAAQSTRPLRPVMVQPPVADVGAPLPSPNRRPGGPSTVVQVQPGAIIKRAYPAYACSVGILSGSEKSKNPDAKPRFYDVEFSPVGDNLYHSNGMVLAFNQFSFRMIENAGVVEFKVNDNRADYVKAHGEIPASWIYPVKWTLATGQIEGTYTQYWFVSGVSGTCRVK